MKVNRWVKESGRGFPRFHEFHEFHFPHDPVASLNHTHGVNRQALNLPASGN